MRRPHSLLWVLLALSALGAAPVRDNTYQAGDVILPAENMANEDAIFQYLQDGVDVIAAGAVNTAAIADGAVTSAKIQDGTITTADLAFTITFGNVLPSGAVFFMLTGSCPAWTTDVSSTYSDLFLRINTTPATLGGGTTHTHTVSGLSLGAHTHSISNPTTARAWNAAPGSTTTSDGTGAASVTDAANWIAESSSGASSGGSTDAASHIPSFVTMKACRVT